MRKTQSQGNIGGQFTNGDPATNTPATFMDSEWGNDVQAEIISLLEAGGVTPDVTAYGDADPVRNQMVSAIGNLISQGGIQTVIDILNNVTATNIASLVFNKTITKAVKLTFHIKRRTDDESFKEFGELFLVLDEETNLWDSPVYPSRWDDAGVTFTVIPGTGQIQYAASNMAGANYVGKLTILDLKKVNL